VDSRSSSLADVLERVLDKGVVIVGDIAINVVDIELLTLRLRLFIASAQTAKEMGMDWWTNDPFFSPNKRKSLEAEEVERLRARVVELEHTLGAARLEGRQA
jgi:hypothetical protein